MTKKENPYKDLTDEQILAAYKRAKDPSALGVLHARHAENLFGVAMSYLRDWQDAEDATINIYVELFQNLDKYDIDKFEAWLYVSCRRYFLKAAREKLKRLDLPLENIGQEFMESIAEFALIEYEDESSPAYDALNEAIERLDEPQKNCIIAFYFQKKTYKEIEELYAYSPKAVKSNIQNGRRNLGNMLAGQKKLIE